MTEYPIIFSGPMITALLATRKTQTRLALKPVLSRHTYSLPIYDSGNRIGMSHFHEGGTPSVINQKFVVGDRLWVREAWRSFSQDDSLKPSELPKASLIYYEQDGRWSNDCDIIVGRYRASIHMPRWASRITLGITGVSIERLHDISESDAFAEGIERITGIVGVENYGNGPVEITATRYFSPHDPDELFECPIEAYEHLWDSINGPDAWDDNPWVAVVSFDVSHG